MVTQRSQVLSGCKKFIFLESMYLKPAVGVDCPSFVPLEVQQSSTSVIISDNVKIELSLDSTSLLGIEGLGTKGGEQLQDNDQEKLTKSILAI